MLTLEDKKAIVKSVAETANGAMSALAAEYSGLTVAEMTELRVKARESGVTVRVVKNTLARRALSGTGFEAMTSELEGPLVMAFSMEDPSSAARVLTDYAKEHKRLVIRSVALPGQLLRPEDAESLAKMPTKDEAISMLMSVMKAPVQKLVQTLNEVPGKLVRTVAAIRDAKEAA